MDLGRAHRILQRAQRSYAEAWRDDIFDDPPMYDAYRAASPELQEQLRDAAEVVVLNTDGRLPEYAAELIAGFWGFRLEPERLSRLVAHYRDAGLDDSAPLAHMLQSRHQDFAAADLDEFELLYVAEPHRHLRVGQAVLRHRPDGRAFEALCALVRECDDPQLLAAVWTSTAAHVYEPFPVLDALCALIRPKPLAVRKAMVAALWVREDLLRAGIGLGPRD